MYAEAKIELNEIDDTVLDAMNQVRARAKASVTATSDYPAITERSQDKLRTILRTERRMEFAFENLRLYDIWRWRIAEKVLNRPWIGLPKKDQKLQRAYIDNNMWFHGAVPQVDEDGCVDFMAPVAKGAADFFNSNAYAQILAECKFVAPKELSWPLPDHHDAGHEEHQGKTTRVTNSQSRTRRAPFAGRPAPVRRQREETHEQNGEIAARMYGHPAVPGRRGSSEKNTRSETTNCKSRSTTGAA